MTIYSDPSAFRDTTPSVAQRLGTATGMGLSEGLQMLAKNKIEKMKQERLFDLIKELSPSKKEGGEGDFLDSAGAQPSFKSEDLTDAQILAVNKIDPKMATLLQAQKSAAGKEVASKFKETKEIRKEILNQSKAARENDTRLDRMEKLNDSGKLIDPLFNATLKKLGLDVPALKNPESQEFEKLTNDMFRNIREIFGNRINVIEILTFLKTIPTLSQTQEGKKRVIRNLKLLNRGAQARVKSMREIIKENGGIPPYDLGEQVEERISGELDSMSKDFISGASPSLEIKETEVVMIDPSGARFAVEKKDVKEAKKAGYKLGT